MIRLIAGLTVAAALAGAADRDMQRAIAFQRAKDRADARQAAKERRHPSVTYNNSTANRSADEQMEARPVKDPGPPAWRKHEQEKKKK